MKRRIRKRVSPKLLAKIKEFPILALLRHLGIKPPDQGTRYIRCLFHRENTPSLSISPKVNLFYCFGCQAGGGVINLVILARGCSFREAVLFIGRKMGLKPSQIFTESLSRLPLY